MGQRILSGLTSLMGVEDVDINISADSKGQKSGLETISAWILQLSEALGQIPNIDLSFSSDVSCSPLQRCLAREIFKGKQILSSVLDDISSVRCGLLPPSRYSLPHPLSLSDHSTRARSNPPTSSESSSLAS
jgi:hypothetical protein